MCWLSTSSGHPPCLRPIQRDASLFQTTRRQPEFPAPVLGPSSRLPNPLHTGHVVPPAQQSRHQIQNIAFRRSARQGLPTRRLPFTNRAPTVRERFVTLSLFLNSTGEWKIPITCVIRDFMDLLPFVTFPKPQNLKNARKNRFVTLLLCYVSKPAPGGEKKWLGRRRESSAQTARFGSGGSQALHLRFLPWRISPNSSAPAPRLGPSSSQSLPGLPPSNGTCWELLGVLRTVWD